MSYRHPQGGSSFIVPIAILALSALGCATSNTATAKEPSAARGDSRTPSSSQPDPTRTARSTATLKVRITNVEVEKGSLFLALFASASDFENSTNPVRSVTLPVSGSEVSWRVTNLPTGTYAVKIFHDLDGDGQLDRGSMGIPNEPYGISNDARGRLGPPSFAKAAFSLPADGLEIVIGIR